MGFFQQITIASIIMSVFISFGLIFCWLITRNFDVKSFNYLLYYLAYLLLINIPKLVFGMYGYAPNSLVFLILNLAKSSLIFGAAVSWFSKQDRKKWFWLVWAVSSLSAGMFYATGNAIFSTLYRLSLIGILILTLYGISMHHSVIIVIVTAMGFFSWGFMEITFRHVGNFIGPVYGMLAKAIVFGCIILASFEYQHSHLLEAYMIRRKVITKIADIERRGAGVGGNDGRQLIGFW